MIGLVRDQVIAQEMKGQILGSVEAIVTTKREESLDPVVESEIWLKSSRKTRIKKKEILALILPCTKRDFSYSNRVVT